MKESPRCSTNADEAGDFLLRGGFEYTDGDARFVGGFAAQGGESREDGESGEEGGEFHVEWELFSGGSVSLRITFDLRSMTGTPRRTLRCEPPLF